MSKTAKHFKNGVQRIHSDGGGEYVPIEDDDTLTHTRTAPDTPQRNPFVERCNRAVFDLLRTLLTQAGSPKRYCEDAANHAIYVKNRLFNKAINDIPFTRLTGKTPKLIHRKTFGRAALLHNSKPKSKVHSRASPAIYLGIDDYGVHMIEAFNYWKNTTQQTWYK